MNNEMFDSGMRMLNVEFGKLAHHLTVAHKLKLIMDTCENFNEPLSDAIAEAYDSASELVEIEAISVQNYIAVLTDEEE